MTTLKAACPAFALTLALAVAGGPVSAADPAGAEAATTPLWAKQCVKEGEREVCFVEQYAIATPGNAVLLNVRIGFMAPGGKPRVIMTAPLGILLMPGLVMTVDSATPVTLPLESCQPGGCRTVVDLDQPSLDQIRRGARMTVRFVNGDGKGLDIPVPLKGLDAALKQLKR